MGRSRDSGPVVESYGRPRNYQQSEQYRQQQVQRDNQLRETTQAKYGDLAQHFDNGIYDPNSKTAAQDMNIALARAEWNDWLTRFLPVEQELANSIGNADVMNSEIERYRGNVTRAFDQQAQQRADFQRRYGIQESAPVAQHNTRTSNIMRAAAMADAGTDARRDVADREMNILAGFGG